MATIEIQKTPLLQKKGDSIIKLYVESSADQIKMKASDGITDSTAQAEIQALRNVLAGHANVFVKDDITARDEMTGMNVGDQCWVLDASDDDTVDEGAALYLYQDATKKWVKIAETESMDVILKWANLQDKPESAVEDIDDAVLKKHEHENKEDLDKLSIVDGVLQYDGKVVAKDSGYVSVLPSEEGFEDAVSGLDLSDGAIFTIVSAS